MDPLRHRNQFDLRRRRIRVRKTTHIGLQCARTILQSSPFLRNSMLNQRILQFLDLTFSAQLTRAAIRAAGPTTKETRRRFSNDSITSLCPKVL